MNTLPPLPPALLQWFLCQQDARDAYVPPTPSTVKPLTGDKLDHYAQSALNAECDRVRSAREGNRNSTMNKAAFSLGTLAGAGAIQENLIRQELLAAASQWPGKIDWKETERTMESGLRSGLKHPRALPETVTNGNSHSANGNGKAKPKPATPEPDEETPFADAEDAHRTDIGNAARFAEHHSASAMYCASVNNWHIWDGTRWRKDESLEIQELAKQTVRAMYEEALSLEYGEEKKRAVTWALKSEEARRQRDMVALARSDPALAVLLSKLDADPYLLNCPNVTLDLRTGEPHAHDPAERITRSTGVIYDPDARCPLWDDCLDQWFEPTPEVIPFLQRSMGYNLTGDQREQCMWIHHGNGRNGKSVFLNTVTRVLGDYACPIPARTFEEGRKDSETLANIAKLAGVYLATSEENDRTARMATGLVKQATGGGTLTGKFLYSNPFSFEPRFKLHLATNHRPEIKDTDDGIWRRLRLVPWGVKFTDDQADLTIKDKLYAEAPGILAWMVRGAAAWRKYGLNPPAVVSEATADYRKDSDTIGTFLHDCLVPADEGRVPLSAVYALYRAWQRKNNEAEIGATKLTRILKGRPELKIVTIHGQPVLSGYVARAEEDDQYATQDWVN